MSDPIIGVAIVNVQEATDIQFFATVNTPNLPAWARNYGVHDNGDVYLPLQLLGEEAHKIAWLKGVQTYAHNDQYFARVEYLIHEWPEAAEVLRAYAAKVRAAPIDHDFDTRN